MSPVIFVTYVSGLHPADGNSHWQKGNPIDGFPSAERESVRVQAQPLDDLSRAEPAFLFIGRRCPDNALKTAPKKIIPGRNCCSGYSILMSRSENYAAALCGSLPPSEHPKRSRKF
jgi:hypothetical protein